MVPGLSSRRTVLLAGSGLLGSTLVGRTALSGSDSAATEFDPPWPMARCDPGGTSFARGVIGPTSDVTVAWKIALDRPSLLTAPTPVVTGGRVYVAGRDLVAVDVADGTEAFRYSHSSPTTPAVAPAEAYRTPTVTMAGTPLIGVHGRGGPSLFGWRPLGKRWTAGARDDTSFLGLGGPTRTPPVAVDGTVLAYVAGTLVAVDPSDGTVRWEAERTQHRPAVQNGTAYALGLESIYAFDLETGDRRTLATLSDGLRSVTATSDRLLVDRYDSVAGVSYDGAVDWEYSPDGDATIEDVPLAAADGDCYAVVEAGRVTRLVELDASDGTVSWSTRVSYSPGDGPNALAISERGVYLPTAEGLLALDRDSGRVLWQFDVESGLSWSSVALGGERAYAVRDDTLYALEEP